MPRITKRKAEHRSGNVAQIGLLTRKTDASVASQIDAFRQGLQDLVRTLSCGVGMPGLCRRKLTSGGPPSHVRDVPT